MTAQEDLDVVFLEESTAGFCLHVRRDLRVDLEKLHRSSDSHCVDCADSSQ